VKHSFLLAAKSEYLEAIQYFESQRAGLGVALIAEFERAITLVAERPNAWKLVHPSGIRRIGLARFPYAVFYRVLPGDHPQVTAFAHHRRRPGYWLKRVEA
jgi:toxin ParE1/3/4